MAKAKKQVVTVVDGVLRAEYPSIKKVFTRALADYSDDIRLAAMDHGFKQKFGDAASGQQPAEKYAEVIAIDQSLMAGNWERVSIPDLTPLICLAVSRLKGLPLGKVEAVAAAAPDTVKEWGAKLTVKAEIAKIRAERAAKAAEEAADEELEFDIEV